jgi:hypothetical protein
MFAADEDVSYLFSSRSAAAPSSQPDLILTAVSVVPEPGTVTLNRTWTGNLGVQANRTAMFGNSSQAVML